VTALPDEAVERAARVVEENCLGIAAPDRL
jgi:hypothetical protein